MLVVELLVVVELLLVVELLVVELVELMVELVVE